MARRLERQFASSAPEATRALGRCLGQTLPAGAVLSVDGELGSGKTVFVNGLAEGLGVEDEVDSPTFTLMKEYAGRLSLYHFDAWMEGRERAFLEGGGEDVLHGRGVAAIEWGMRVADLLPVPHLRVALLHLSENERRIHIALEAGPASRDGPGARLGRQLWASVAAVEGICGLEPGPGSEVPR